MAPKKPVSVTLGDEEEAAFKAAYAIKKLTRSEFIRQAIKYYADRTAGVPDALREYLEQKFAAITPPTNISVARMEEVFTMYTRLFVGAHNIHFLCRVHIPIAQQDFPDRDKATTQGRFQGHWLQLNQAIFRVMLRDEVEISSYFLNFIKTVDKYEAQTTDQERQLVAKTHSFFIHNLLATMEALEDAIGKWQRATSLTTHPSFQPAP